MLVLSRKDDESIVITHPDGTQVTIQVVSTSTRCVRLAIAAPDSVRINRKEVEDRRNEQRELPKSS